MLPPESAQVDYEAEIGVVIGKRVRRVSESVGPLSAGDVVEVEITGVGVLRNPVAAKRREATAPA